MGHESVRTRMKKAELNAVLDDVLRILEADDGNTFEEKRALAIDRLKKEERSDLTDLLLAKAWSEKEGAKVKNHFWQCGEIPCGDGETILRDVHEADRNDLVAVRKEYYPLKEALKMDVFSEIVWNEHNAGDTLMCSIIHKGEYAGYCGIADLWKKPFEITIELYPHKTNQKIGKKAICAMLDAIKERMNICQFKIRIDPQNIPSQKMFNGLGAKPKGILKICKDLTLNAKVEADSLHEIDEQLIEIAEKFAVEPRLLLTHVLEYSLEW